MHEHDEWRELSMELQKLKGCQEDIGDYTETEGVTVNARACWGIR